VQAEAVALRRIAASGVLVVMVACGAKPAPVAVPPPKPVATVAPPAGPAELELERALPIQANERFEPSGLVWFDGRLLCVSDKEDGAVFELSLSDTEAVPRVFTTFQAPPAPEATEKLDFEGIAEGSDGKLLLVSEAASRVLEVTPGGGAVWLTPSLAQSVQSSGLLQQPNAGFEGLVQLPDGHLLLVAERQPRGLVELTSSDEKLSVSAWRFDSGRFTPKEGRVHDFTDLTLAGKDVYVLERNAAAVVRLERHGNGWAEREGFLFGKTEDDPRFAYADRTYGLAEALAIDRHRIYVALDSNAQGRAGDADDVRPVLFVFKRPSTP
jgi:uncharacterized protein YjiK